MNYQEIADLALKKLNDYNKWEKRYYDYSEEIAKNEKYVTAVCKCFRPKAPLTKYLSIGKVKDVKLKVDIDLRIMGTSIATITVKPDKNLRDRAEKGENIANEIQKAAEVIFNKKGLDKVKDKLTKEKQNEFENLYIKKLCKEENIKWKWNSYKLKRFRSFISQERNNFKNPDEHMVETLFLRELSKKSSNGKYLRHIQPCKICEQYYQLVTPFAASNAKNDELDTSRKGGGIDILARCKKGSDSTICVIELKDKYEKSESPEKAIKQAIAYATFIIKLIRSKEANGAWWYKEIMGISKELTPDKPIKVYAVIAMPYQNKNAELPPEDTDFINKDPVKVGNDEIHLHYIYFKEEALKKPQILNGFTCSFI